MASWWAHSEKTTADSNDRDLSFLYQQTSIAITEVGFKNKKFPSNLSQSINIVNLIRKKLETNSGIKAYDVAVSESGEERCIYFYVEVAPK